MTRSCARVTAVCVVLLMGVSALCLAGCQDLTGTVVTTGLNDAGTSSSVEQTTSTQTTKAPPTVDVTRETGTDPCLIVEVFSQGGYNYVVVDFIQVKWTDCPPILVNQNRKLRTFIVPETARLGWFAGEQDPEDVARGLDYNPDNSFAALISIAAEANEQPITPWGFWEIEVVNGEVVRLEGGREPDGYWDRFGGG